MTNRMFAHARRQQGCADTVKPVNAHGTMPDLTQIDVAQKIESAVQRLTDQDSLIQGLLRDALGWPIDLDAAEVEEITLGWAADELGALSTEQRTVQVTIRQYPPLSESPWRVFFLDFKNFELFTQELGRTRELRRILRGLVRTRKKDWNTISFGCENLLFICNHGNEHVCFAHFNVPKRPNQIEPLTMFGWSQDDPIRAMCEFNLKALAWPSDQDRRTWSEGWSKAFDVDMFTQRFFQDYAKVFSEVEQCIGKACALAGEQLQMFTQILLNRLMFIRFIEQKHWLSFEGRHDYLKALFEADVIENKSLYGGRIRPLIFEGLAIKGRQNSASYGTVPFLGDALFEATEVDRQVHDIPDDAFEPILGPDGLIYRYNFTCEESMPLEINVAVDPEMLGKVFEELVTGRHESGAYYTPRSVVSFMCREALKGVLERKTTASENAVASLVDEHDAGPLSKSQSDDIVNVLDDLKAVDPACGSGAYMLGLLHEMISVYSALAGEQSRAETNSLCELKLRIITNNLHGADVDPFATKIAMLRLWLSLAVEAEKAVPLPDLDFKIETGDSLLPTRPQFTEVFSQGRKGFDIVLANPPYVRKEQIPPQTRLALRKAYESSTTGQSDLYCYFYARGMQLLTDGGMHVFVCSNSWLDSGYGRRLQQHLLSTAHVLAIYDCAVERQFATADINTIISVIQKGRPKDTSDSKFVLLLSHFDESIRSPRFQRVTTVTQRDLWRSGQRGDGRGGLHEYRGNKWGGKYLRSPAIYETIIERAGDQLQPLGQLADIQGYVHDNNTGGDFPIRAFLKTVRHAKRIKLTRTSPGVRRFGVKQQGNSALVAPILFPRTFGERHIVVWNVGEVFGKEFYKVIPINADKTVSYAAQLNSTLGILQREILGLVNLGDGAIKFSAEDVALFDVAPAIESKSFQSAFEHMASRELHAIEEELRQEDRQAVDSILFEALGLTAAEQTQVYSATVELVKNRTRKAKSRTRS